MSGNKWFNLQSASEKFIRSRAALNNDDLFSVIFFGSTARTVVEKESIRG